MVVIYQTKRKKFIYFADKKKQSMQSILSNGYSIHFNENGYEALDDYLIKKKYSSIFAITDSNTSEYCIPHFMSLLTIDTAIEIIEIDPGESFKTIETCVEIWNILTEFGADRKSLIINLGGGVISDLGGFIASTFKRGIDFINVPTTLLGMVDAAIGGKNGVDLGSLKNQVGTITSPQLVLIDSVYLDTLPQNEMLSGFAEMLKHGLIADKNIWKQFLDLSEIDFTEFDQMIYESVQVKNNIVMQDPTENGIRKALNFGHTLGHAIESLFLQDENKSALLHGEAIAAGMILESFISYKKNLLSREEYYEIKYTIKNLFEDIVFSESDIERLLTLLIHDKKNEYGNVNFALLDGIGKIAINQNTDNDIIIEAFKDYKL